MPDLIQNPLTLPCGAVLKNRIAKSAMSEGLATRDNRPTPQLATLFSRWARGGAGLIITGNVMVDSQALVEPNVVAIEDDRYLPELSQWAKAGTANGAHLWMQINHPGRVAPRGLNPHPTSIAPSAIPLRDDLAPYFTPPRAASEEEILALVQRFARTAEIAKQAGFTGVEIHAAHGYLLNQFLSPLSNQRKDRWGGSIENRMRVIEEIYRAIREKVGPGFAIGLKLNSADFQKGGFSEEESIVVASRMCEMGLDLLEISGGTYEAPAMQGQGMKSSSRVREAYFLDFAEKIRKHTSTPLLVTGGFRTAAGMRAALAENGTDVVGLARALAIDPEVPERIFAGEDFVSPVKPIKTGIERLDKSGMVEILWYARQLARLSNNKAAKPDEGALYAVMASLATKSVYMWQSRRLRG